MKCVLVKLLFGSLLFLKTVKSQCSSVESEKCTRIAGPLIKEAHLIFPDNMNDIKWVCNVWSDFVDCLDNYTGRCFTEEQRRHFKKLIAKPLESVHKMCTQALYQKDYLLHAPCMKSTVMDGGRCRPYYQLMLQELDRNPPEKTGICCSHGRFKQCVLREVQNLCDNGLTNGSAYRLSLEILSNAFSSTEAECENYIPNSDDCPLATEVVSSSTVVQSWNTTDSRSKTLKDLPLPSKPITTLMPPPKEPTTWEQPPEDFPSKPITTWVTPSKLPTTWLPQAKDLPPKPVTTWLPSSPPTLPEDTSILNADHSVSKVSNVLGTHSRPSSYGKASSWPNSDAVQPVENSATTITINGDNTVKQMGSWMDSGTTWYPAAGSQLSNEVDEPNQLGWVQHGENNNKASHTNSTASIALILIVFTLIRQL